MSTKVEEPKTKTFGKASRTVPAASQKASKWYPADDEAQHKKVGFPRIPSKIIRQLQDRNREEIGKITTCAVVNTSVRSISGMWDSLAGNKAHGSVNLEWK